MLEKFATSVFTQVLGRFVKEDSFQQDSIRIGVWNGSLTLKNIELKTDILDNFGLPLTLRHGR